MFPVRPSPGDKDEDIISFQERFLASGERPSAKVVRCPKLINNANSSSTGRTHSQQKDVVALDKQVQEPSPVAPSSAKTKETHKHGCTEDEMEKYDDHITNVLANIVHERNTTTVPVQFPKPRTQAFPSAFRRSSGKIIKDGKRVSKSIFAQQFKKQIPENSSACKPPVQLLQSKEQHLPKTALKTIYPNSRMVSGDLSEEIHEENIEKLSKMTETDILEKQNEIKSMLNPKLIEFIKNRKSTATGTKTKEEKFMNELSKQINVESEETGTSMEVDEDGSEHLIKVEKSWIHMDDVEQDKTKWMRDIKQSADRKTIDLPHRFDFEGELLSPSASDQLPTHLGLHHHGSEPGMGGYTLQELLDLTRSEFAQQRVLALRTLSRIVFKDKRGRYGDKLESVTPVLVEAGIALIVRWALDERSESCMRVAIEALFSLLTPSEAEDTFGDVCFFSTHGVEHPCFQPRCVKSQEKEVFEISKDDLILAFAKADVLLRIRYILEVCRPDHQVVVKCLGILKRICQHSVGCSTKVLDCPRLVNFIVEQHLPVTWQMTEAGDTAKNGLPVPEAIQVLRAICQSGRHACARLLLDHQSLVELMMRFVAAVGGIANQDSSSNALYRSELECLKLWSICASYGYLHPEFREVGQPVLLQLRFCVTLVANGNRSSSGLLLWVEHFVKFVSCVMSSVARQKSENPSIELKDLRGAFELVSTIMKELCQQLKSEEFDDGGTYKVSILRIASVTFDVLATYYARLRTNPTVTAVDLSDEIENDVFPALDNLHDVILELGSIRHPAIPKPSSRHSFLLDLGLNSLPLDDVDELTHYVIAQRFVCSYVRTVATLCKCCKRFLGVVPLVRALTQIDYPHFFQTPGPHALLSRLPSHTLYWATKLSVTMIPHQPDLLQYAPVFHKMALSCLPQLPCGDEHYGHDLLSTVLFHTDLFCDCRNHNDSCIADFYQRLAAIRTTYMTSMTVDPKLLSRSRAWYNFDCEEISTFFLPPDTSPLVPADWPFLPLVQLYDVCVHQGDIDNQEFANFTVSTVISTLQFIYALEVMRPGVLDQVLCPEAKLARLMCVYLAGSDVFLESYVQLLMRQLFKKYCVTSQQLDFDQPIPGLTSFYDFYISLLEQYEAVSFGDSLFSAVLLLPLTSPSSKYKLALWEEHREALRAISLKRSEVLLGAQSYFVREATSRDVARACVRAVAHGHCGQRRNPFLYQYAVHTVATFIFAQAPEVNAAARMNIVNLVSFARNDVFQKHVFNYQAGCLVDNDGLDVPDICPERNQTIIRSFLKSAT